MESMATEFGAVTPAGKGEPGTGVAIPVVGFNLKAERSFEPRLATTARDNPEMPPAAVWVVNGQMAEGDPPAAFLAVTLQW
jgi:hypothetical protein